MTTRPSYPLTGVHHVSALSAQIGRSHDFHTRGLGLRPVIRAVNQDDPGMYHLFFGDGAGTPGSDMTVFDMPRAARERRGNNSISRRAFRVAGEATLEWWAGRLASLGVPHGGVTMRDGRAVLDFDDAEGTALSLASGRAVYVREPSHVLFELATDGPGFAVDGPLDGERLSLPPLLEPRRAEIEARLRPLH